MSSTKLPTISHDGFGKEFLDVYLLRGFGNMTKSELDVLIFSLIRKYVLSEMSIFEISRSLKISESKVRTLIYESDLKYSDTKEETLKKKFGQLVENLKFKIENDKIMFSIEDKLLRSFISSKISEIGAFSNTSFNRNMMVIHSDMFIDLLTNLYGKENISRLECELSKRMSTTKTSSILKSCFNEFLKGAAKETGVQIVKLLVSVFTGGSTNIHEIINKLIQNAK